MDNRVGVFKLFLRGDSIAYLTEVIQNHYISRLMKAQTMKIGFTLKGGRGSYPEINSDVLQLLEALLQSPDCVFIHCSFAQGTHKCITKAFGWEWHDVHDSEDILSTDQRVKMVRALAYRAGVFKMTGEAFSIIALKSFIMLL